MKCLGLMKPLISAQSFNDFYAFKKKKLSVHSSTRTSLFESWLCHPPAVTLGKSLNRSGPWFPLLENVGLFLEESTAL